MRKWFTILVSLLLTAGSAKAIVVADYVTATNTPIGIWNLNWDYIYNYKGSSAVAVGPHWLLTAAHVADDGGTGMLTINGTNYYQQEIIFHAAANDPEHANKADLALVRFDKEFPGYYPLYTNKVFPTQSLKRLNAVMVGYGVTGAVYSTYYTASAWNDPSSGIKRWGSQKIDGIDTANYDAGGGVTYNDGIKMMFSSSDTPYEAGAGVFDSGGGTFVTNGGVWKLAGINTVLYGDGVTNTGTFAVSVPAYETWATNVMNPTGDLDGDGIPNYWEQRYGTTTGLVASANNDSDGFTNYQEYLADTNPTNSASFFAIDTFVALANQTVTFLGSTARQYQVFYTTNDLAATNLTWIAAHTNKIWGAGTNSFITVTNTANKAFYRLKATLP
ncbi:MAG: trypsin-like serine protease [Kiritimatiellales bacterium]